MRELFLNVFQTLNEILSAGIAITAISLLIYAFTFNLRDRVARSFAMILVSVVIVFVGDALSSTTETAGGMEFWLRFQWVGITFLPASYLHFSNALLATTGTAANSPRYKLHRLVYLVSLGFLAALPFNLLVGPLNQDGQPAPHLQRTWLTWIFTAYYGVSMIWSWLNFRKAYQRTITHTGKRRMQYLVIGSLAPALGSYPYLLFGSTLAAIFPIMFWLAAIVSNMLVFGLLVVMAYSVAYFGVAWPDRVVKRRLIKWLMRGPVAASAVLGITTLVRRAGLAFGYDYTGAVPLAMVASILVIEHLITLLAPGVERVFLSRNEQPNMHVLQSLEERLVTLNDLRQFLESVLAAACDQLQVARGFLVVFGASGIELVVTVGGDDFLKEDTSRELVQIAATNGLGRGLFAWGEYWLVPLFNTQDDSEEMIGLIGIARKPEDEMEPEQEESINLLADRAATAIEDRNRQQIAVSSLEMISPQMEMIQRVRAAARYDSSGVLDAMENPADDSNFAQWVKDALSHYWGGPKLTQSPLMRLKIVERAVEEHEGNPVKALRAILTEAIERTRPEGERRFTGEWILYNILEMKFLEGRKVREIALRLAMSEADLYRKQRVAIEAVAEAINEMERQARDSNENDGTKYLAENG